MPNAGVSFQLLKPGLKAKYVRSVQHTTKKLQQSIRQQECTKTLNSSEGTSIREGEKRQTGSTEQNREKARIHWTFSNSSIVLNCRKIKSAYIYALLKGPFS